MHLEGITDVRNEGRKNKADNICINVTSRRVRAIIFVVEE
jgi:hypothetical protein